VCCDVIRNINSSGAGLVFSCYVHISTVLSDNQYEKLITKSLGITVNRVLLIGIGIDAATARISTRQIKSDPHLLKDTFLTACF